MKRLNTMTHEDFIKAFGVGYAPSLMDKKIGELTSLYAIHTLIAMIGDFDTYEKLQEMGYDVIFKLDRQ